MIVKRDSWVTRFFLRLPQWLFHIESCRVGNDYTTYVKIEMGY